MATREQVPLVGVRMVEVDGLRMRVMVREGTGAAAGRPPLLLCNGIGGPIELWEPFLRAMGAGPLGSWPLIAFDAPGVGESGVPAYPPTMHRVATTIGHLLDELGAGTVDVLGVSWGGALAQELAYRHGARVRRLILCATSAGGLAVPGNPKVLAILATPLRYWSPSYLNRVAPTLYGPDIADDPDLLARQRIIRFSRGPSGKGYIFQILALRRFTSGLWLHRLKQPTLVMAGDADPIVPPANGRILAARLRDARLEIIPGGGHLFLLTRAETMAEKIRNFLTEP